MSVFSEPAELAAQLAAHGLDARARSALRAYASNFADEDEVGLGRCGADVLCEQLSAELMVWPGARALARCFSELPVADFSPLWMLQLQNAWRQVRREGAERELPLRIARVWHQGVLKQMLGDRTSLSRLELEIVLALDAAARCAATLLIEPDLVADAESARYGFGGRKELLRQLEAELERNPGVPLGLLWVSFVPGAVTLTLELEDRIELSRCVHERVETVLRDADILVRTENHSFAIILPDLETHAQVVLAASKVAQCLDDPVVLFNHAVKVRSFTGASWLPDHADDAGGLIRCANVAAHEAQALEKPLVLFETGLIRRADDDARLEREFITALDNGQLALHVQPQFDLKNGRVCGGEVLMRWTDNAGNPVAAHRAPEIAQRLGLGPQLRHWLIQRGCRLLAELNVGNEAFSLSLNLTAPDLADPELPLLVAQALQMWKAPAECLTFELTENLMLEDSFSVAEQMKQMRAMGISLAVDDFGTGYSSVSYLRQLPLNELKIDRSFVQSITANPQDREIVASLIRLAHALGLSVVAEGVEDRATLAVLRDLGCDKIQGYLLARAMPPADLDRWQRGFDLASLS